MRFDLFCSEMSVLVYMFFLPFTLQLVEIRARI